MLAKKRLKGALANSPYFTAGIRLPVLKGDLILLDFNAKIKETGSLFDTTSEELARKEKLYKEGRTYEPLLVAVGEGWIPKGLDEALVGKEIGVQETIEIPPEKGFGQRDPSKIKLIPLRRFAAQKVTPYPGLQLDVDGRPATIRSVGAGRVQVDYNPPLAGKTLVYDFVVKKILSTAEEKIQALIHRRLPLTDVSKVNVTFDGKAVSIELPEESFLMEGLQLAKRGIASDLHKFLTDIDTVNFIERYVRRAQQTAASPAALATQERASAPEDKK
jgi:peptidylprolyl isomerase